MMIAGEPSRHRIAFMLAVLLMPAAGCNSFFNSWLDPTQVGSFTRETTLDIRTSLSIQDTPLGIAGATDPRPEDLKPIYDEYRFGPGDVLSVRIFELLARNTETNAQATVDDIGTISLPVLGQVRVAGMTRSEITEELARLLQERGIIVREPKIVVEGIVRRGQTYLIFGATAAPNLYPLPRPDTRLLEAINIAGGLIDNATEIYVIREENGDQPFGGVGSRWNQGGRDAGLATGSNRASAGARSFNLSDGVTGTGSMGSGAVGLAAALQEDGATGPNQPATRPYDRQNELIDAVGSPSGVTTRGVQGDMQDAMTPPPAEEPRWIYLDGKWVQTTAEEPAATQPRDAVEVAPPIDVSTPERTRELAFPMPEMPPPPGAMEEWDEEVPGEETRIIRISAEALRSGDYRQNIVIRGGDTIRIMAGQTGEYYLMGQVNRPGAYSLTGRQITLKTAVASAGNLAPLAWPDRCTIYRRYNDREEMHQVNLDAIFAGKEPDVMLKNNDLILVGTHPVAPFLAVVRNAFRLTYGFGFVYDRNFADRDAYGPKVNPENLPDGFGSRFPNLFQ